MEIQLRSFLIYTLDGIGGQLHSTPPFSRGGKTTSNHQIWGCLGPQNR